jgi:hypothetical protein
MLFIAVALFGMLAYAFSQGTRTSMGWLETERQNAAVMGGQDCSNSLDMAQKRLQTRGCGNMVSFLPDGSNPNPGAPADGSCSIFHSNGGGVKPDCVPAPMAGDPCATGSIGAVCQDMAIYIGDVGGKRIYVRNADSSAASVWSTPSSEDIVGASSATDGSANTDAMMAAQTAGPNTYPPATACRVLGAQWYLPAPNELKLLWTNRVALNLTSIGISTGASDFYWSSQNLNAPDAHRAMHIRFSDGWTINHFKNASERVRCVRQD